MNKRKINGLIQGIFMAVLIILEVVPMTYLNHYYVKNIPDRQIYIIAYSVLLVIFDFTLIYAFRRINLSYQKENELELKRRAAELEAHYYEDIEKQQEDYGHLFDAMRRQISLMEAFSARGDTQALQRCMTTTQDLLKATKPPFTCSNHTLMIVLSDKYKRCTTLGIDFQVDDGTRGTGRLSDFDITTIFANLLDNAIEASTMVTEAKIRVVLREKGQMLAITIENPYDKSPEKSKDGLFKSSKQDVGHGLGLKNVQMAAERYEGSIDFDVRDGWFVVRVLLPVL